MESQIAPQKSPPWLASIRWKDLLKILLALVLIGLVFSRTNLRQIAALGNSLSWSWVAASFLLFLLMTALKGVQYWALLGHEVPYPQTVKIVVIQNALTNLVATTAGIASYLTLFRMEQNVKLSRSGIVFIITKAGDLFSMCFFLFLSAWLVWDRVGALQRLVVLLLAGIFLALGIFWTVVFLRQKFVLQIRKVLHWLHLDRITVIERGLNTLQSLAEQDHKTVIRTLFLGLTLSLCYMTTTMAYAYCRIQAFHIPIDFWAIIFITSLMQMVSLIPVQAFGGLGVTELTSLYLYQLFGIVQVDIPAILIGLRVLFYLFNLALMIYLPMDTFITRLRSTYKKKIDRID